MFDSYHMRLFFGYTAYANDYNVGLSITNSSNDNKGASSHEKIFISLDFTSLPTDCSRIWQDHQSRDNIFSMRHYMHSLQHRGIGLQN
uniref:Uncharacterized protein n=1 Tax=Rhizophagus irregularis (strain DAOM 181602 / DAOM 197198 / MUCL 43194) TaxID=747089 RepID=U9V6N1_RHIID